MIRVNFLRIFLCQDYTLKSLACSEVRREARRHRVPTHCTAQRYAAVLRGRRAIYRCWTARSWSCRYTEARGYRAHDEKRDDTTTRFAALDVLDGRVISQCQQAAPAGTRIRTSGANRSRCPRPRGIVNRLCVQLDASIIDWARIVAADAVKKHLAQFGDDAHCPGSAMWNQGQRLLPSLAQIVYIE
jgi:hypothetical protein